MKVYHAVDHDVDEEKQANSNILLKSPLNSDAEIQRVIDDGLHEDLSNRGDLSTLSTIPSDAMSAAYLLAKADGIISGLIIAERVFSTVDSSIKCEWLKKDGDTVSKGDIIGNISGKSQSILTAERLALNLMQRMSGIATQTNRMVQQIKMIKTSTTKLLDTRKTVPGLRIMDKMAVVHGGGINHRMGLYDMVMIKDNHIEASGGIKEAIENANRYLKEQNLKKSVRIEIETSTLDEVKEVLKYGSNGMVDRIMLDNMVKMDMDKQTVDTSMLVEALALIKGKFETEASGNITLFSVQEVAKTNVDFVSTGAITHSVTALDISMKFKKAIKVKEPKTRSAVESKDDMPMIQDIDAQKLGLEVQQGIPGVSIVKDTNGKETEPVQL